MPGIRARDGRCVISGMADYREQWTRFEAAHTSQLKKQNLGIQYGYGRWITDMGGTNVGNKFTTEWDDDFGGYL